VSGPLGWLFASGFFESDAVRIACGMGALVAVVCGVVGVFTVMRGQSFAGHAFSDTGPPEAREPSCSAWGRCGGSSSSTSSPQRRWR